MSAFNRHGSGAVRKFAALMVIFLGMVLLSGCLVRVQPIEDTPTPVTPTLTETPTATLVPTNTINWFPATATPRPMHTPTPVPTIDQLPRLGKTLLSDDFSDEEDWPR